jgi:hypothetical protein
MTKPAQRKPGEANPIVQLAVLVAILIVILNVGFYFLSDAYFADRVKRFGAGELARIAGARVDFGVFTVVVGGATIFAGMQPRIAGHALAVLAGLGSMFAGFAAFGAELGFVLPLTLLVVSGLFDLFVVYSLRKSRAAWSALSALCAVYAVVMLFGAPKLRGMLDIGMWLAMIVPGLLAVATWALSMIRDDYRERT